MLFDHKKIKNHHLRGLYYSAARSFLFNEILSRRVGDATWNHPLNGDLMMLAGTHSIFHIDAINDEIIQRTKNQDISPTAPLWGKGEERLTKEALQCQNLAIEPWKDWCLALEQHELQRTYRAMVLLPSNLEYQDHVIKFTLPPGTYATTVIRELLSPIRLT